MLSAEQRPLGAAGAPPHPSPASLPTTGENSQQHARGARPESSEAAGQVPHPHQHLHHTHQHQHRSGHSDAYPQPSAGFPYPAAAASSAPASTPPIPIPSDSAQAASAFGPTRPDYAEGVSVARSHSNDDGVYRIPIAEGASAATGDGSVPASPVRQSKRHRVVSYVRNAVHWFLPYVPDWLAVAVLLIIAFTVPLEAVHPLDRHLTPGDPALSYPYLPDTVPGTALAAFVVAVPGVVFAAAAAWVAQPALFHHGLLALAEAVAMYATLKQWINMTGVYRPDWFAGLASGSATAPTDGRRAYPSGHAGFSFTAATVLTAFALGRLELMAGGHRRAHFPLLLLCCTPLAAAAFIAASRITDYKHERADVNAGAALGAACGLAAYLLNFHSPLGRRSGEPRLHRHKDLEQQQHGHQHHGPQQHQQQQLLYQPADAGARAPNHHGDQQEASLLHPSPPHTHSHAHRHRGLSAPPLGSDMERGEGGPP